jgi:hypothetical protein
MVAWSAGCSLFQSHPAPPAPAEVHPASAAPARQLPLTIHYSRVRPAPTAVSKPPQPQLNLPPPSSPAPPPSSPAPLVTLQNSGDAKADAQHLLAQARVQLARVNRAELAESTASTYQQANELINAAQRAMADQDYLAASSLAEKASALTSQLPPQK